MSELEHIIGAMAENRQHVWDDTPEGLVQALLAEVYELQDQVQETYITGEITPLALEIADVLNFTIRLCIFCGLKPEDILAMKNDRNARKYPDVLMMPNGRTKEEAVKAAKKSWDSMGGDKQWSHAYLDELS